MIILRTKSLFALAAAGVVVLGASFAAGMAVNEILQPRVPVTMDGMTSFVMNEGGKLLTVTLAQGEDARAACREKILSHVAIGEYAMPDGQYSSCLLVLPSTGKFVPGYVTKRGPKP